MFEVLSRKITPVLWSVLVAFAGCTGTDSGSETSSQESPSPSPASSPSSSPLNFSANPLGPLGGFIPSITFRPGSPNEVWASADDSSGIYKSTDGGIVWNRVSSMPQNQASFAIRFSSNGSKIWAPSFYGRGMLSSGDGGATWTLSPGGLPIASLVDTTVNVYDLAVKPGGTSSILFAATGKGLYKSADGGATFSLLNGTSGKCTAVAYVGNGNVIAAFYDFTANTGSVKYSTNDGATWSAFSFLGTIGSPVARIASTSNAIYLLAVPGDLFYVSLSNYGSGGQINSSSTQKTSVGGAGLYMGLATVSGATQATDTLYLGLPGNSSLITSRWGLFKSSNGGGSWTQLNGGASGLSGNVSVQTIAVDPSNSSKLLIGTINSVGIYRSTDGGSTWTQSNTGLIGTTGLAVAQNPFNFSEWILSSSAGKGLGRSYRSLDAGATWAPFAEVNDQDGVFTFDFDPAQSGTILAGMHGAGLYRSTAGTAGPWTQVIVHPVAIGQIYRDRVNPQKVVALATGPDGSANARAYASINGGASFSMFSSLYATAGAVHPTHEGELVVATPSDILASANLLAATTSLNAGSIVSTEGGITALAFDAGNPSTLFAGGAKGGLYMATQYHSTGAGVSWTVLNSPFHHCNVQGISVFQSNGQTYYLAVGNGSDVFQDPTTVCGAHWSNNGGQTWNPVLADASRFSATGIYRLVPIMPFSATHFPSGFMLGGFGGGTVKLSY